MALLLVAVAVLVGSGALSLALGGRRWGSCVGALGAVAGSAIGLLPALAVLAGAPTQTLRRAWQVPYGAFFVQIDPLSAFFLVPIFALSALAAVYGTAYLDTYRKTRALGVPWFFFNALAASMVLVVVARNAVLFLVAWELMALASFFLVTFEDEKPAVRDAGRTYLVATHFGTACLLVLFILLGRAGGTLDFDGLSAASASPALLFLLAVVGFGTKAGLMPLHVWLPDAHPAAPSHVSAVMSGVMIKTGIYGLLRILTVLGPPPPWWGWALCAIGVTSGALGVLLALAQRDLKRILAYSSVENIGIIAIGVGVGEIGLGIGAPAVAVLGFAGALLHVVNHAAFKGLLFLGAGAVAHATGTRDIDDLGGLLPRMPRTGAAFLVGAAAITGLPPLSGFVGELLIYLGALTGIVAGDARTAAGLLCVVGGLGLIGGLAAACFTRAFGITFLGVPRTDAAAHAHEPRQAMTLPMLVLAAGCAASAPIAMPALRPVIAQVSGLAPDAVGAALRAATPALWSVAIVGLALLVLIAVLAALRRHLLAGREVAASVTWDCGYARPTPRMQYGAASFSQPLTDLFRVLLHTREQISPPEGHFPRRGSVSSETPDICADRVYVPVFTAVGRALSALRWLQHGDIHLYIGYILLAIVVLLFFV